MSVEALTWAFGQEHVPSGPRFVLVALANRANEEGGDLYPSLRWIRRKTGIPERTIREHIKELMRLGLLLKTPRTRDDGGNTSNEYRLPLTQPGLRFDTPPAATAVGGDSIAAGKATEGTTPRQALPHPPAATAGRETKDKTKEQKKETAPARRSSMPDGFAVSERVMAWAKEKGFAPYVPLHFEHFLGHVKANRGRYADWDEALMNCIRADWGGVRKQAQMQARHGGPAMGGARQIAEWWETRAGVEAMAQELGVEHRDDPERQPGENFLWLKAKVCVRKGEGPWMHSDRTDAFQRYLKFARKRDPVHA